MEGPGFRSLIDSKSEEIQCLQTIIICPSVCLDWRQHSWTTRRSGWIIREIQHRHAMPHHSGKLFLLDVSIKAMEQNYVTFPAPLSPPTARCLYLRRRKATQFGIVSRSFAILIKCGHFHSIKHDCSSTRRWKQEVMRVSLTVPGAYTEQYFEIYYFCCQFN